MSIMVPAGPFSKSMETESDWRAPFLQGKQKSPVHPTGNPEEIHAMTEQYWKKYWQAAPLVDLEEVDSTVHAVPPFDPHVSADDVLTALRKLHNNKARGPDQWSTWELKNMPDDCADALAQLYTAVIGTSIWP